MQFSGSLGGNVTEDIFKSEHAWVYIQVLQGGGTVI